MSPFLPAEDPSESSSLAQRTVAYVRANPLLRILLAVTVANHLGAVALLLFRRLAPHIAGLLIMLSVLAWFFAVALPVMNREVRLRLQGEATGYWSEVVEMFARVVLCAQTGLYTALLVMALLP